MKPKLKLPRIRLPSWPLATLADVLLVIAGFAGLARGLWLVYPPVAWIVCGALLMWAGWPSEPGPSEPTRR